MFAFGPAILGDFDAASSREWLETNGVGGWASSSLAFANTRRYHGLLVAGSRSRPERTVIVSKLEETVVAAGRCELGCNRYPGAIHPTGYAYLTAFRKDVFPEWEYEASGLRLRKTVVTPRGENTTIIVYEVLDAPGPFELQLRPFLTGRDYHSLLRRYDGYAPPAVEILVPGGRFQDGPDWYYNFDYDKERERGLDHLEDLFTPGFYSVTLDRGSVLPVTLSVEGLRGRDPLQLVAAERERREQLIAAGSDELTRDLTLAADQFIVDREGDLRTVIAGYHWFTDWGRDTMISLAGLCLATRRFDDARNILRRFLAAASKGMIPNRFAEGAEEPAYNSVDAGLLLFVAVWDYLQATTDVAFVRNEALPVLLDSIAWLDRGTRYNIHVDEDGLLFAGAEGVQLTWMDAKVGDWVVTPRAGKPVEINALWYNALRIAAELTETSTARADYVKGAFQRAFWNAETGCCYDVIGDASIRPNQLFALSLPFPLFEGERAESILRVCEEQLLTPFGLRTLTPHDPRYQPRLVGDQRARDAAYHQGTVWPWLLGPYHRAVTRVRGRSSTRGLLDALLGHLSEAGIGTISECFDGDAPHTARGCIAQAWSVAEILRAYLEESDGR